MSRLYLGLDSSTQSLTAIVLDVNGTDANVVLETALSFDDALPAYGTSHGVLPSDNPAIAVSSPLMWADALDVILARVRASGLDLRRLSAVSGSAQQHGSVYLAVDAAEAFRRMDPTQPPAPQIGPVLARPDAPIWMDSSTTPQCSEITATVGGSAVLAQRTGSRAFERFTAAQIRKFARDDRQAYERTGRVHLVSSYLASLLTGGDAPLDPGDASGMNLMDLKSRTWWAPAVEATAPGLLPKLPRIAPSSSVAGTLSTYWQQRHGLPAVPVITWSGDNPCSLVGVGLVREGRVAISLGTSDTIFGLMREPRVDPGGTGHVFGSPTGDFMGLTCFSNGSLAREHVRDAFRMSWGDFSQALDTTPPGNRGRVLLPWFGPEITPTVTRPGAHRYRLDETDGAANARAVVEAQQMAMALHSRWMGVRIDTIMATGGAAVNASILRVMSDVFGAEVVRTTITNSAALGAALRAWHGDALASGKPVSWDAVVNGLHQSTATRVTPDPRRHDLYRRFVPLYEACEQHALGNGPDPSDRLAAFAAMER